MLACSSLHHSTRSSAYSADLTPLGSSDTRSLMNTRKRVGDRTPPWGTPWRGRIFLLLSWSRLTRARLLNRYDLIHLSMLLATPFLISLTMSPSIHTLSNARCMSIQATRVAFFLLLQITTTLHGRLVRNDNSAWEIVRLCLYTNLLCKSCRSLQNLEHKCVLQESCNLTVRRWQTPILLVKGDHWVGDCGIGLLSAL